MSSNFDFLFDTFLKRFFGFSLCVNPHWYGKTGRSDCLRNSGQFFVHRKKKKITMLNIVTWYSNPPSICFLKSAAWLLLHSFVATRHMEVVDYHTASTSASIRSYSMTNMNYAYLCCCEEAKWCFVGAVKIYEGTRDGGHDQNANSHDEVKESVNWWQISTTHHILSRQQNIC